MSWGTWISVDPEKSGVTLEELEHRAKLREVRESFLNEGWTLERYYSHEGGEIAEYKKYIKLNPLRLTRPSYRMTVQIMEDYKWKIIKLPDMRKT